MLPSLQFLYIAGYDFLHQRLYHLMMEDHRAQWLLFLTQPYPDRDIIRMRMRAMQKERMNIHELVLQKISDLTGLERNSSIIQVYGVGCAVYYNGMGNPLSISMHYEGVCMKVRILIHELIHNIEKDGINKERVTPYKRWIKEEYPDQKADFRNHVIVYAVWIEIMKELGRDEQILKKQESLKEQSLKDARALVQSQWTQKTISIYQSFLKDHTKNPTDTQ